MFESTKNFCFKGFRVQGVNSVAAESHTIEVNGNKHLRRNKKHSSPPTRCVPDPQTHRGATSTSSATTSGLLGLKHDVNDLVSSQIWMSGLPETWVAPHEQDEGMLCFFCCFITSQVSVAIDFNWLGFGCNKVYPLNSGSVLWTQTLHPLVHRHSGEYILCEFKFNGGTIPLRAFTCPADSVSEC